MILLVSGLTGEWARMYRDLSANVGFLVTPSGGHKPETVLSYCATWAADNDCFSGFDRPAYERMLARWRGASPGPLFVLAPDVVADAAATLKQFAEWAPVIRSHGFPVGLAAQDGLAPAAVPWPEVDALFVGGSTAFKLSDDAYRLCREARRRGKHVHMGRVNSLRRMETAARFGCDSIDGSGFSRWRKLIAPGVRWVRRAKFLAASQPLLFTGAEE